MITEQTFPAQPHTAWLWPGVIPLGGLVMLVGDTGIATEITAMAAQMYPLTPDGPCVIWSRETAWPGGADAPRNRPLAKRCAQLGAMAGRQGAAVVMTIRRGTGRKLFTRDCDLSFCRLATIAWFTHRLGRKWVMDCIHGIPDQLGRRLIIDPFDRIARQTLMGQPLLTQSAQPAVPGLLVTPQAVGPHAIGLPTVASLAPLVPIRHALAACEAKKSRINRRVRAGRGFKRRSGRRFAAKIA